MDKFKIFSIINKCLIIIFVLYTMINSAFLLIGFEEFKDFSGTVRGVEILKYYTNISNILGGLTALISLIYLILKKKENNILIFLQIASSVMLTITCLTVIFYLAPVMGWFIFYHYSGYIFSHFFVPVMVVLDYLLFSKIEKINKKMAIFTTIPTVIYAIIIMSIVLIIKDDSFAPYPFLMVNSQPAWLTIIIFILFVGVTYGLSILYILVKNKMNKKDL